MTKDNNKGSDFNLDYCGIQGEECPRDDGIPTEIHVRITSPIKGSNLSHDQEEDLLENVVLEQSTREIISEEKTRLLVVNGDNSKYEPQQQAQGVNCVVEALGSIRIRVPSFDNQDALPKAVPPTPKSIKQQCFFAWRQLNTEVEMMMHHEKHELQLQRTPETSASFSMSDNLVVSHEPSDKTPTKKRRRFLRFGSAKKEVDKKGIERPQPTNGPGLACMGEEDAMQ